MESQLRDDYRRLRSRRVQERTVERDYTWVFESAVSVARRPKQYYVSHLPETKQPVKTPQALAASTTGDSDEESP